MSQDRGELLSRSEVAEQWYDEEYRPVVEMLREAELIRAVGDAIGVPIPPFVRAARRI